MIGYDYFNKKRIHACQQLREVTPEPGPQETAEIFIPPELPHALGLHATDQSRSSSQQSNRQVGSGPFFSFLLVHYNVPAGPIAGWPVYAAARGVLSEAHVVNAAFILRLDSEDIISSKLFI